MTNQQALSELRKEFRIGERLADLLLQVGRAFADETLRGTYKTNDGASLIRLSGEAAGVEKFLNLIIDSGKAAQETSQAPSLEDN